MRSERQWDKKESEKRKKLWKRKVRKGKNTIF